MPENSFIVSLFAVSLRQFWLVVDNILNRGDNLIGLCWPSHMISVTLISARSHANPTHSGHSTKKKKLKKEDFFSDSNQSINDWSDRKSLTHKTFSMERDHEKIRAKKKLQFTFQFFIYFFLLFLIHETLESEYKFWDSGSILWNNFSWMKIFSCFLLWFKRKKAIVERKETKPEIK